MKILRIAYDWPPPWDGLAPAPLEMTKAQLKLGHSIEVFCGRWLMAGNIEELEGVKIHSFIREPLPGTMLLTTAVLMFFYYLFWRRTNNVDIIHSHGHFGAWIYLYRYFLKKFFPFAKELKIPLVAHFHNTVAGRWEAVEKQGGKIKVYSRYLSWPLAKISDQLAVKVASACIFVSEDTKRQAVKYYKAEAQKCFVVETGVNTQLFSPVSTEEKEKTRKEMKLFNEDRVIMNHGAMVERKNIHLLVEALLYLPHDFKLLLVGPGDDEYIKRLTDFISEKKLKDRVVMVGYTPYPQVPIAFQASDLFVLPSSFEGLPKVVFQSLACNVPVLASGFRANEEISGLFYLSELKPEVIASSVERILDLPVNVDINKVRNLYSWDVKAKKVDEVYEYAGRK